MEQSCEDGNKPEVPVKDGKFLDRVSNYEFLKRTLLQGVS